MMNNFIYKVIEIFEHTNKLFYMENKCVHVANKLLLLETIYKLNNSVLSTI
jgi:hypothetical protein